MADAKNKQSRNQIIKALAPIVMQDIADQIQDYADKCLGGNAEMSNAIYMEVFARFIKSHKEFRRKCLIEKTTKSVTQRKLVALPN